MVISSMQAADQLLNNKLCGIRLSMMQQIYLPSDVSCRFPLSTSCQPFVRLSQDYFTMPWDSKTCLVADVVSTDVIGDWNHKSPAASFHSIGQWWGLTHALYSL